MPDQLLNHTAFLTADQEDFATLSGDCNPLHLDAMAARRELFGTVVVHGVHALLRLLEAFAGAGGLQGKTLRRCRVRFVGSIELERKVALLIASADPDQTRLQIKDEGQVLLDAQLDWAGHSNPPTCPPIGGSEALAPRVPRPLHLSEIDGRSGSVPLAIDPAHFARLFPALAIELPSGLCAQLLALTRLVGMECPGLRSIFSGFDIAVGSDGHHEHAELGYRVTTADRRFSMVKMEVSGPTVAGTIDAFFRPPPAVQPDMDAVQSMIDPGAFAGQCALIIGGSRGLGEVTAKIIAAGGGHPLITHHRGSSDADAVVEQIRRAGCAADRLAWDVTQPAAGGQNLAEAGWRPTHLYFFASPKIFVKKQVSFRPALFQQFVDFYVSGLFATLQACRTVTKEHLVLFYPSTVALDQPVRELAEYAAAKAAGEALCRHLERFEKDLSMLIRRLPRIATDQTASLLQVPAEDALEVLTAVVTEAHRRSASTTSDIGPPDRRFDDQRAS